jgi:hypothetical protein
MKMNPLILIIVLCIGGNLLAQTITGKVIDVQTNEPLLGAAVYYDNTSIGTSSDEEGKFSIPFKANLKSPLIISFLVYHAVRISTIENNQDLLITMTRKAESLDEVVVTSKNAWSRESMLQEFLKLYLGESENGLSCRLLNPEDLVLSYYSKRKQLRARAKAPLIIRNERLQYIITVDLSIFEANYWYVSKNKKRRNLNYVHYSGNNFFTSMTPNPSKETLKLRRKTYKGSVLHFMRAIANDRVGREGYEILAGSISVSPKRYIEVEKQADGSSLVRFRGTFTVLYKNKQKSVVKSFIEYFAIDSYGNHSPSDAVRFGGVLGLQRMGDTLPLDYIQ